MKPAVVRAAPEKALPAGPLANRRRPRCRRTARFVVPADAGLTIRARLEPVHVDQVHPGQEAALRFLGFSARNTPEFEGRIRRVSADRVRDERSGLSRYEVEVAMGAATAPDEGSGPGARASSAVAPGMAVEVNLRTGDRSPLSYLGKSLTDFFSRSLREE